jgi:hypothetical protein
MSTTKTRINGDNEFANCCGTEAKDWEEMMGHCPLANLKKDSKVAFLGVMTTAGLVFVIAVAGWAMGVLAFFRTF